MLIENNKTIHNSINIITHNTLTTVANVANNLILNVLTIHHLNYHPFYIPWLIIT